MFHLLSHTQGKGGESLLVDGFAAARQLKLEDPEAYAILSSKPIPTHASGNFGISIQPFAPFPVFNHHPSTGELVQVRWNNDDRATMDQWSSQEEVESWYRATRKWSKLLRSGEFEYWEQLRPGRPMSMLHLIEFGGQ
jgi:trimethyllysine dioxygenase